MRLFERCEVLFDAHHCIGHALRMVRVSGLPIPPFS